MERIYHTWDKWECFPCGFYDSKKPGMTKDECEEEYRKLLSDCDWFAEVLNKVITEWKHSCEHYLSNSNMNRIAWLGQACLSYELNIPACYRGGYNLLSEEEKEKADAVALVYLNKWLVAQGEEELDEESVKSKTVANLY